MRNCVRLGKGLRYILTSKEFCKEYLPKVKSLQIQDVGDRVYRISGWQEYQKMLGVIAGELIHLYPTVDILIDQIPVFNQKQDVFVVMDTVVAALQERIDELAGELQHTIDTCNAVMAGRYSLRAWVSKRNNLVNISQLEWTLAKNPFLRDASISVNSESPVVDDVTYEYDITISSEDPVTVLRKLESLWMKSLELGNELGSYSRHKEALMAYVKEYGVADWDTDTIDLMRAAITNSFVKELEKEMGELQTNEERFYARNSLLELCDLQAKSVSMYFETIEV